MAWRSCALRCALGSRDGACPVKFSVPWTSLSLLGSVSWTSSRFLALSVSFHSLKTSMHSVSIMQYFPTLLFENGLHMQNGKTLLQEMPLGPLIPGLGIYWMYLLKWYVWCIASLFSMQHRSESRETSFSSSHYHAELFPLVLCGDLTLGLISYTPG